MIFNFGIVAQVGNVYFSAGYKAISTLFYHFHEVYRTLDMDTRLTTLVGSAITSNED